MKIETEILENHQAKLTVEVDAEQLEDARQQAARKLGRRVKIPGFRPGKAPFPVIVRQIGEAAILEEALDILIRDLYPQIIEQSGIRPYGPGSLKNVVSMDPPVLEFEVPLDSEVTLGDYRSISREYNLPEVAEKEVEKVFDDLRTRQAVIEPVERPAGEGDMVNIRLSGTRTQVEPDEDPVLFPERSMPILIRPEAEAEAEVDADQDEEDDSKVDEWPFPGFSRHLIGLSAGDERTIMHTFAEDADYESLRGVEAEFKFVVEGVKSRTLPELNDEFATSLGEYETLEALRKEIRESLEQQARDRYHETYDQAVLDELVEQSSIKYPPQMEEQQIDEIIENLKERLQRQHYDMDLYLKSREMEMDDLRAEARPVAEKRLKRNLVLYKLADVEKIEISPEELQNEAIHTMSHLLQGLPENEARKVSKDQNVFRNVVNSVMVEMVADRAMERLRGYASGQYNPDTAAEAEVEPAVDEEIPAADETEAPATSQAEPDGDPADSEASEAPQSEDAAA